MNFKRAVMLLKNLNRVGARACDIFSSSFAGTLAAFVPSNRPMPTPLALFGPASLIHRRMTSGGLSHFLSPKITFDGLRQRLLD